MLIGADMCSWCCSAFSRYALFQHHKISRQR